MKHRTLSKRLRAVETALAVNRIGHVPSVLAIRASETRDEAFARYAAQYPHRPANHTGYLLVTAAKPETGEERAEYARRFKSQQVRLAAEARSRSRELAAAEQPLALNPYMVARPAKAKIHSKPWGSNPNR